ncbi:hypothetical protein [Erwinia sp. V71]|uniref:hypothetical protein n=1 Tax=Erwinia sp. V71 TaxID=3369424 RepID=UPI003F5DE50F
MIKRSRISIIASVLVLAGCTSDYQGTECTGQVESLSGVPLGQTQALIIDRFNSFSVTTAQGTIHSGTLHSSDRRLYFPSAVTREGYLAQRLSAHRFCLINSPQDQMVTYTCH